MFFDHNGVNLEISNRDIDGKPQIFKNKYTSK